MPRAASLDGNNADSLLASYGLAHPRPYQINEYATADMQTPGGGAWFIGRLERSGSDGLRGLWSANSQELYDFEAGLLTKDSTGQYLPLGEWFLYRYYGSMTGNVVNYATGNGVDGFATKDNAARTTKFLIGSNGNTGNVTVNFTRLDTANVAESGRVRAVVQRVPWNNGGAVQEPTTIADTTVMVTNNATSVVLPFTDARDAHPVTLLPPSKTSLETVAVAQHSQLCLDDTNLSLVDGTQMQQYQCEGGYQQMWTLHPVSGVADTYTVVNQLSGKCLDVSGLSTADGAQVIQWTCTGGTNQQFALRHLTYSGASAQDYQLVARHSGKCVDVQGISTAPRALIHQWTCHPPSQASPANQTWRLLGATAGSTIIGPAGRCVDVNGDDTGGNTAAVQLWDCQATAQDQRWLHASNNSLQSLGRCMDIVGNATANGALAQLYNCNGGGGQQWAQQTDGTLKNPQSGRCLNSVNAGTGNGARLEIRDCTAAASEMFRLT